MTASVREKQIYGANVEILEQDNEHMVYQVADDSGELIMTDYSVFTGINLIYNDIHACSCSIDRTPFGNILEINHCREGRVEREYCDEFFYLAPGDLAISQRAAAKHTSFFPLSNYHGVTVRIDIDRAPACLSCFLDDVNVRPDALAKKFCGLNDTFVMRARPGMEHIFSELYSVPESIRKGYFKVKVLELLLFLSGVKPENEQLELHHYSGPQVALAKNVCRYLTANMESKITIAELAARFRVSQTQIKTSFRGVYGMSVYAYIRVQKMQAAAQTLRRTNCTVLEVAGRFGYDNGSKFAKAFRDVMGLTPNEYRISEIKRSYEDK